MQARMEQSVWSSIANMLTKIEEQQDTSKGAETQCTASLEAVERATWATARRKAAASLSQDEWTAIITKDKVRCLLLLHVSLSAQLSLQLQGPGRCICLEAS
jgi:hypothetical protein